MSGVVELALLTFGATVALVSLACALAMPVVRRAVAELAPDSAARSLAFIGGLPFASGVLVTVACFLPTLVGFDHCATHDDHHAHFCIAHGASGNAVTATLATIVAVALMFTIARGADLALRSWRAAARLDGFLCDVGGHGLVACDRPFAVTIGLLRPRIVLSTALVHGLSGDALDSVLAHERAHVERGDNLRKLWVAAVGLLHLPSVRKVILRDLDAACERACDELAALSIADRLTVAETLLAVERLRPASLAFGSAFASDIEGRVTALLAAPVVRRVRLWPATVAAMITLMLASDAVHDAFESLIGYLG